MKAKRFFSLLLCLCMVLSMVPLTAHAATVIDSGSCGANGNNVTWSLDSNGTLTISGSGKMARYNTDMNSDDDLVYQPWYDYRSSIKSVVISDGVTGLGFCAFHGCSNLETATIADSVTELGGKTFWACYALKSVNIPEKATYIGYRMFCACDSLTSITIPGSVTSIEDYAFYGTGLTAVIIPDSVRNIGDYAFKFSDLDW